MPATSSASNPHGTYNPYGDYAVWPTPLGIAFQVSVRDPSNNRLGVLLIAKSLLLAVWGCAGWYSFTGVLACLFALDAVLYVCLAKTSQIWIEVRPDGVAITLDIKNAPQSTRFFDRRAISHRELDYDAGLTFRYGIHDVATPSFASEREFDIFQAQFEQACGRLWLQANVNS